MSIVFLKRLHTYLTMKEILLLLEYSTNIYASHESNEIELQNISTTECPA